jgi:hypothetical protein
MDMDVNSFREAYVEFVKNHRVQDFSWVKKLENGTETFYKLRLPVKTTGMGGSQVSFPIPGYSFDEDKKISGNNSQEIVANISQNDFLNNTVNDANRCGAGSLVNAYLLMGGRFEQSAEKFNINKDLTYKNIHLLQEKLYDYANNDGAVGLVSSYKYFYNKAGEIVESEPAGEMLSAASKLGLEIKPLTGKTVSTIYEKKEAIQEFFTDNPDGVLQVSVFLNTRTGKISGTANHSENHYVTVFSRNNKFFLADTGQQFNDQGKNIRELNPEEISELVYNNNGMISGLTLKQDNNLASIGK